MTIFIQLLGLIATLLVGLTYLKNSIVKMLWIQFSSSMIFILHYFLLGAVTGALLSLLVGIRCIIYLKCRKNYIIVASFMVIFGICGIATWKNCYSILPTIGSVLFSVAFFVHNPKYVRFLSILPSCLWGAYGVLTGSWGGIATEIICLCSIAFGYIKHDYKNTEISA